MRRTERQLTERTIRKGGGSVKVEDGSRRNRDRNDLICEAIALCNSEGQRKTNIMYGVNLSFSQTAPLVYWLEQTGMLHARVDNLGKIYYATEKGMQFLDLEVKQRHLLGLPEDEPMAKAIGEKWVKNGFIPPKHRPLLVDATEMSVEITQ